VIISAVVVVVVNDLGRHGLLPVLGAVVEQDRPPRWLVVFPDRVYEPVALWLRDLAACD
jgi:hypothetical protein